MASDRPCVVSYRIVLYCPPQDNQRLEEELMEIRQELLQHTDFIRSAFNYYSMTGAVLDSDTILQVCASFPCWLAS